MSGFISIIKVTSINNKEGYYTGYSIDTVKAKAKKYVNFKAALKMAEKLEENKGIKIVQVISATVTRNPIKKRVVKKKRIVKKRPIKKKVTP